MTADERRLACVLGIVSSAMVKSAAAPIVARTSTEPDFSKLFSNGKANG